MKGLKIVVLAKQVPDTRNVGKDAMKADGTVNRANQVKIALKIGNKYKETFTLSALR